MKRDNNGFLFLLFLKSSKIKVLLPTDGISCNGLRTVLGLFPVLYFDKLELRGHSNSNTVTTLRSGSTESRVQELGSSVNQFLRLPVEHVVILATQIKQFYVTNTGQCLSK